MNVVNFELDSIYLQSPVELAAEAENRLKLLKKHLPKYTSSEVRLEQTEEQICRGVFTVSIELT